MLWPNRRRCGRLDCPRAAADPCPTWSRDPRRSRKPRIEHRSPCQRGGPSHGLRLADRGRNSESDLAGSVELGGRPRSGADRPRSARRRATGLLRQTRRRPSGSSADRESRADPSPKQAKPRSALQTHSLGVLDHVHGRSDRRHFGDLHRVSPPSVSRPRRGPPG